MKVKTRLVVRKHQREHLARWSRDLPEQFKPLEKKLLSFGGSFALVRPNEQQAEETLSRGVRRSGRSALLKHGDPCNCHGNAARIFLKSPKQFEIATGYALSADGLWRQHSWAQRRDGKLIETTEKRVLYFGFALNGEEALFFAFSNLGLKEMRRLCFGKARKRSGRPARAGRSA
jgi:hypothetical protein